jgi:hypothetical protein
MIYLGSACFTMFGIYNHMMPIPSWDQEVKCDGWIEVVEEMMPQVADIDQGKYWKKRS